MIKQRIMLTEIPEVKYIRYMRSHNSGNIHGENLHIWAFEWKKSFLENWNIKKKKKNNAIIRTSKYESKSERKFGVAAVCLIHADVGS